MDFALSCVMSSGKSLWPPVQCKSSEPANMYIYVNTVCSELALNPVSARKRTPPPPSQRYQSDVPRCTLDTLT